MNSEHLSSSFNSCPERLCEGTGKPIRKDDSCASLWSSTNELSIYAFNPGALGEPVQYSHFRSPSQSCVSDCPFKHSAKTINTSICRPLHIFMHSLIGLHSLWSCRTIIKSRGVERERRELLIVHHHSYIVYHSWIPLMDTTHGYHSYIVYHSWIPV